MEQRNKDKTILYSLLLVLVYGCCCCCRSSAYVTSDPPPKKGQYETTWKKYAVQKLDKSDPHLYVFYPQKTTENESFPLISYAHGLFGGGSIDIAGYFPLFEQIASFGFVVAAPSSCNVGCKNLQPSRYTSCAGTPDIAAHEGWNFYYGEQLKTIEWVRNATLSSPFSVDWNAGVGIAGHSMGGQATTTSAHFECAKEWDLRAAVIHHAAPCDIRGVKGANAGSNITTIPLAAFTSSGDSCCEASTKNIYDASPTRPKIYRDLKGSSHLEPVLIPPIENPFLATYTAAWFKVFLGTRDTSGPYYDLIFSNQSSSVCNYQTMETCEIVE